MEISLIPDKTFPLENTSFQVLAGWSCWDISDGPLHIFLCPRV